MIKLTGSADGNEDNNDLKQVISSLRIGQHIETDPSCFTIVYRATFVEDERTRLPVRGSWLRIRKNYPLHSKRHPFEGSRRMIRGSIEFVSADLIQGWIHTADERVREHTLLAFERDQCVGAGKVNTFRGDLADAGIGDGHLGFSFPISVPADLVGSVVLKLEGSDAMLVQNGAFVAAGGARARAGLTREEVRERLGSFKWALKHGRISQGDFDFLRILWSFGAYERGLLRRNAADETVVSDKPAAVAATLLESYAGTDVRTGTDTVRTPAEFAAVLARLVAQPGAVPVVALHTAGRATVRVAEGSHVSDPEGARAAPFTDYPLNPDHLLILDARASVELQMVEGGSLDVVRAEPTLS